MTDQCTQIVGEAGNDRPKLHSSPVTCEVKLFSQQQRSFTVPISCQAFESQTTTLTRTFQNSFTNHFTVNQGFSHSTYCRLWISERKDKNSWDSCSCIVAVPVAYLRAATAVQGQYTDIKVD